MRRGPERDAALRAALVTGVAYRRRGGAPRRVRHVGTCVACWRSAAIEARGRCRACYEAALRRERAGVPTDAPRQQGRALRAE